MSDLKKLQKKMKKLQKEHQRQMEEAQQQAAAFQSICPHVSPKGKTWLIPFEDEGVEKAKCKKCGDVVIIDRELLTPEMLQSSTDMVKTMLSEIRANVAEGRIHLSDKQMHLMQQFDRDVLRELPATFEAIQEAGKSGGKKKKKDKGKGKKKKHGKKNKAKRVNW